MLKNKNMKKLKLFAVLALAFTITIVTTSCQKDENKTIDNTSASADDAFAESLFDNITKIADEAYNTGSVGLKSTNDGMYLSDCATVTLDTTSFPHMLTIDFGEENCLCNDGRYRRGKILLSFTGRYWWPGTVLTYTFDDFYVNDNRVEGTKVITNMGYNDEGNYYFNVEVISVIHRIESGKTLSWNSSTVREWIEGATTWNRHDDVYLITGSSNGIRPNGNTWTREIVNPLRVEIGCKWIVSGTMEITPEGLPTRIVDWGNGECDNIITVIVNGVTYTVFLP